MADSIISIGKTGAGKSTLGNLLLEWNEEKFYETPGLADETGYFEKITKRIEALKKYDISGLDDDTHREAAGKVIIAIGSHGAGKSTFVNSLAEKLGEGLTYQLDKGENERGIFYDTPGLADETGDFEKMTKLMEALKKRIAANMITSMAPLIALICCLVMRTTASTYCFSMISLLFLVAFSTAVPVMAENMGTNDPFPSYHLKAHNDKEYIHLPPDTNWDAVCELRLLIKIPGEEISRTVFSAEHAKFGNEPLKFTIDSDGRNIWREHNFCFASCVNVATSPLLLSATSNLTLQTNITIIPKIRKDACERITNPLSRPAVLALVFVATFFFTIMLLLLVQRAKLAMKTLLNQDQTPKIDEFAIHSLLGQDQNPGKQ